MIVCNTTTGAVSEYDWRFQSLTSSHAGDAVGLYGLGGDTDDGELIKTSIRLPRALRANTSDDHEPSRKDSRKMQIASIVISMQGAGRCEAVVHTPAADYAYPFDLQESGEARARVGRGIRENYLGVSVNTLDGQRFLLDQVEIDERRSVHRRVY